MHFSKSHLLRQSTSPAETRSGCLHCGTGYTTQYAQRPALVNATFRMLFQTVWRLTHRPSSVLISDEKKTSVTVISYRSMPLKYISSINLNLLCWARLHLLTFCLNSINPGRHRVLPLLSRNVQENYSFAHHSTFPHHFHIPPFFKTNSACRRVLRSLALHR